ncbi:Uma2 family endonuclease [Nostoc sp.]|uniref:Uma2 family endonuclease n=1 Tax=Nostoc sp. TaxID=1180 RepID=UPI002FF98201
MEIANSSLKYDREVKAIAYSKSGIINYWILDVNRHKLYMYRLLGYLWVFRDKLD